MSLSCYIKEYNLIAVASKDKLFFWKMGSQERWFPYIGIRHPILKMRCVPLNSSIVDGGFNHGLVIVTSEEVCVLGVREVDLSVDGNA